MLDRLANKAWFRVERSWPPDAVKTTAPVIDVLADLSESLLAHGVVLDGLEADGTLDRSQAPAVVQLAVDTVPEAEDGGGSSDEP